MLQRRLLGYGAVVIVILVIYYKLSQKPKVHHYWDKQPVSRNFSSLGKISKTRLPSNIIPPFQTVNFNILNPKTEKLIKNFIDHHFLKGYQYSLPFLRWSMPNNNTDTIGLVTKPQSTPGYQLVGTISSKMVTMVINGQTHDIGYVDYLAVHQDYRGHRLATALISKVVETYHREIFLFKIEDKPLPFDVVCKFRYYVYPITQENPEQITGETNWTALTNQTLDLAYQYYQQKSSQFRYYQSYTRDQFKKWFLPDNNVVSSFIMLEKGQIIGFTSFFSLKMKSGFLNQRHQNSRIAELLVFLSNDITQHLKQLLPQLFYQKIDYFVATNLGKNKVFIDRLPFIPGKRCYLQMYNYGTGRSYDPSEILVNIP